MYQYKHVYFTTWSVSVVREYEKTSLGGRLNRKTVVSEYDGQGLENYLNGMSSAGWELISMEAKWYNKPTTTAFGEKVIPAPHEIMGWYLTFKRLAEGYDD